MRKQFVNTIQEILYNDENTSLLLGDIGVFGFRKEITNLPDRVMNAGILEQCMISVAAGLSLSGIVPFIHTIAPFIVERAFEQIKIDFGYQKINGNFISVGASNDYAALGSTHHCPGDVSLMLTIPEIEIFLPGSSKEVNELIKNNYTKPIPKYYRLSEYEHSLDLTNGAILRKGDDGIIIVYGNMVDDVFYATENLNFTVLYLNTINEESKKIISQNFNKNIIICEPFYKGTTNHIITEIFSHNFYNISNIGFERKFIYEYGTKKEQDEYLNLNVEGIRDKIIKCTKHYLKNQN
jgi:transketolase